jgi:hypothetical protein
MKLDLEFDMITDAGLAHLKKLPRLRELDLRWTKVTAGGVNQLKKVLPNCQIAY